ncbi:hypothetical protein [Nocardia testacea]|uniref:hypothetical protein n=1 Tax=Nocardia testacea TaxID=248551 RepID=UPI003A8B0B25
MTSGPDEIKLTDDGYLPYGVDVDRVVAEGVEHELVAAWYTYHYNGEGPELVSRDGSNEGQDLGEGVVGVEEFRRRRIARESKYAPVTATQALKANARLVEVLLAYRWRVMADARYDGKSWTEIGQILGMTASEASGWYRHKAVEHAAGGHPWSTYDPDL